MKNLEVVTKQGTFYKRYEIFTYNFINQIPVTELFKYASQIYVLSI